MDLILSSSPEQVFEGGFREIGDFRQCNVNKIGREYDYRTYEIGRYCSNLSVTCERIAVREADWMQVIELS